MKLARDLTIAAPIGTLAGAVGALLPLTATGALFGLAVGVLMVALVHHRRRVRAIRALGGGAA